MDPEAFATILRRLARASSRRGVVRGGLGTLLAPALVALGLRASEETAAKRRHHKKKQRHRRKKRRHTPPLSLLPPPPPPPVLGSLVGMWREEVQFACETGAELTPARPIGELVFRGDGTFAVTWIPFERYYDYWGTYVADLPQHTLRLQVSGGNYIPPDLDGEGAVAFDAQGRLLLTELWLGSPARLAGPVGCGHRFRSATLA